MICVKNVYMEKNCQFLATHKNIIVDECTGFKNEDDFVPRSEVEELETRLHLAEEAFKVASENAESARDKVRELEKQLEQAKQEVAREIIQMIQDQARDEKYYAYADIRNAELAELTIKILNKYIGETE